MLSGKSPESLLSLNLRYCSLFIPQNSGISSVNWLKLILKYSRFFNFLISLGIWFVNLFLSRFNLIRELKLTIESGIEPESSLFVISKFSSVDNSPMDEGMLPLNLFFDKINHSNFLKLLKLVDKVSVISLLLKFKYSRFVKLKNSIGIWPFILLSERSKYLRLYNLPISFDISLFKFLFFNIRVSVSSIE